MTLGGCFSVFLKSYHRGYKVIDFKLQLQYYVENLATRNWAPPNDPCLFEIRSFKFDHDQLPG